MKDLPDDMEFLKAKVAALVDHTGLADDVDDEEDKRRWRSQKYNSD